MNKEDKNKSEQTVSLTVCFLSIKKEKNVENRIGVHRDKRHIYDILISTSFGQLAEEVSKLKVKDRRI